MLIKKTYQGTIPENKVLNNYSESKTDVYSCDYVNQHGGGGGTGKDEVYIQPNEPYESDWKIWIDTDEVNLTGSEVVDDLEGNQDDFAPSVRAVNDKLNYNVLYQDSTGVATGSITTNDNPLNYSRIDVLVADGNSWNWVHTFYPKIINTGLTLNAYELGSSWTACYTIRFDLNSTGLTISSNLQGKFNQNSASSSTGLKIIGIVGYK